MNSAQYKNIQSLIYCRHLHDALLLLQSYLKTLNEQSLFNRWHSINENYKYLLNYFAQGVPDNNREQVFCGLQEEAFQLLDEIYFAMNHTPQIRELENLYLSLQQQYIDHPQSSARLKCAFYRTFFAYPEEPMDEYIVLLEEDEQMMAIYGLTCSLLRRFSKVHFLTLYHISSKLCEAANTLCLAALWLVTLQHPMRVRILSHLYADFQPLTDHQLFLTLQKTFMSTALTPKVETVMKQMETKVAPQIQQHGLVVLEDGDEDSPTWMKAVQKEMEEQVNQLFKLRHYGADCNYPTIRHLLYHNYFQRDLSNWFLPISTEEIQIDDKFREFIQTIGQECDCACDFYALSLIALQVGHQISEQLKEILPSSPHQKDVPIQLNNTPQGVVRNLFFTLYRLGHVGLWNIPNLFEHSRMEQRPLLNTMATQLFPVQAEQEQELAEHAFHVELYLEAALRFQKIREQLPPAEQGELLQQEGYAYEKLGNHAQAIERYQQTLILCNDNFSKRHLALLYAHEKEYDKAILLYNDLLQNTAISTPNQQRYLNNKAWCLQEAKQWADAMQVYIQMEVLFPDNITTQRDLAWTALLANRSDYALKYSKLIIEQADSTPVDWLVYTLALYRSPENASLSETIIPQQLTKDEKKDLRDWLFKDKCNDLVTQGFTYDTLALLYDAIVYEK